MVGPNPYPPQPTQPQPTPVGGGPLPPLTRVRPPEPLVLAQSFVIAQYFTEDLEELVRLTHTDLMEMLQIPVSYYQQDNKDIVSLLYQDISHMIRDGLISGLHLLLCDANIDPNSGFYPLRYHVYYSIEITTEREAIYPEAGKEFRSDGRRVQPPKEVLQNCRLVILIDWTPSIGEAWREVRRPNYCFDWMSDVTSFDATMLADFHFGCLDYGHVSNDPNNPGQKIFETNGQGEGRVISRIERIAPA